MVKLKGFETYELSTTSFEVFSKKTDRIIPLKSEREGAHVYFILFKNGHRVRRSLWSLIEENWHKVREDIEERQLRELSASMFP